MKKVRLPGLKLGLYPYQMYAIFYMFGQRLSKFCMNEFNVWPMVLATRNVISLVLMVMVLVTWFVMMLVMSKVRDDDNISEDDVDDGCRHGAAASLRRKRCITKEVWRPWNLMSSKYSLQAGSQNCQMHSMYMVSTVSTWIHFAVTP